jgi:hypothetical protein
MVRAGSACGQSLTVGTRVRRHPAWDCREDRITPALCSSAGARGRLLAGDLAAGLVASSVTDARALCDSYSRSKLLPLNPSGLNGHHARMGGRASRAASKVPVRVVVCPLLAAVPLWARQSGHALSH